MSKWKEIIIHNVDLLAMRQAKNLTQKEVAQKADTDANSYCSWENGHVIMTTKTWEKLKKVLT